jgi:hypothetical protein
VIVNEDGVAAMGVERERVVSAFPKPHLVTEFDKAIASARRFLRDEDAPDEGGI